MEVKSFKLSTGEELVAQLLQETGTGYKIKNPLVVHMMRTPEGPSLAFAQWSLVQAQNTELEIFDHGLIAKPVELMPEVEQSYIQQTTGLLVPPKTGGQILLS
jgi:hypothetical protein